MEYRALGNTGSIVSALSFDASFLSAALRAVDEQDCNRTVYLAVNNGVHLMEISPFYGSTTAETMLGKAWESGTDCLAGLKVLPLKVLRSVVEREHVDTILSCCRYYLNDDSRVELIRTRITSNGTPRGSRDQWAGRPAARGWNGSHQSTKRPGRLVVPISTSWRR